jgi:hypothetical protein
MRTLWRTDSLGTSWAGLTSGRHERRAGYRGRTRTRGRLRALRGSEAYPAALPARQSPCDEEPRPRGAQTFLRVGERNAHSIAFSRGACHRSSKASGGEDLEIKQPVACWDCSSLDFHTALPSMLGAPLVGDQVVEMCEPSQKRQLIPFGMMEAFHHNRLQVFRNAKASRCGHGIRQARQTKAVW